MTANRRALWKDIAALAGLAVATLAVCWPLGLTNRILAGIDAITYFTPYWSYRMEAFRAGVVPLWNPYLFSGAPFLANIQAAVLYPLHWPLSWLSAERALVWSALLHVWLAAVFTYILARRSFRVSRLAAFAAALIFGLGGFTLARIENINQLNALAWLPALLWLYDETISPQQNARKHPERRAAAVTPPAVAAGNGAGCGPLRVLPFLGLAAAIALQLLAGHTQTTFINMIGLGLWALTSAGRPFTRRWLLRLLPLLAVLPALALAAAQLLPTLELNGLGLRTGGLDFRAAVSFSLRPRLLAQSLLPPFFSDLSNAFGSEGYAEFVGYVGVAGLLLAGIGAVTARRRALRPLILLLAGFLLALGAYNPLYYVLWRFVPGFDLFRAPARWLELYALGVALLAALGLDALPRWGGMRFALPRAPWRRIALVVALLAALALLAIQQYPSWRTLLAWAVALALAASALVRSRRFSARALTALLFVELLLASRALPFTAATAPMATGLRNSTAALPAASGETPAAARDRFLSLSDIRYDPGDLAELRALQADRLPAPAVERLVRAAKQVEVLAPNLPLFFRLPAVDGYDGGLLPLHRYVLLQGLFLDKDRMTPDGRLAEQLDEIPDGRLLDLTGVRYVITDKQRDLWAGDVYYDLEQALTLSPGESATFDLAAYPAFTADALGVVAGAQGEGEAAATITARSADGARVELTLPPAPPFAEPPQPVVLPMAQPLAPVELRVSNTGPAALVLRGLSLIDRQTGAHQSVTVSPRNDFRRVHSGDVKIYERTDALGRAWIVHGALPAADEAAAVAMLADPAFDPRASVVLESPVAAAPPAAQASGESVRTVFYEPERAQFDVTLGAPGWLVVADAWYPGWRATVDGAPVDILRANLLYRAIPLPAGRHEVALTYAPQSWATGRGIALATLVALLAVGAAALFIPFFRKTL